MNKASLKNILRSIGIIRISDNFRYQLMRIRNKDDNKKFLNENPNIAIPPDYLLYEAHQLKYRSYINNGLANAKYIKGLLEKYIDFNNKKVLDWGCGPARIIRHFPNLLQNTKFYASDYNKRSILWNQNNIDNITFSTNGIFPPTCFEDDFFDVIYGLSILTHLSAENHFKWINELYRISKENAVLLLTTHGEAYKEKLIKKDQLKFESNQLVIEGNTLEGHRTFAAYHPPKRIKSMFEDKFKVLEHIPGKKESWGTSQDQWILEKL